MGFAAPGMLLGLLILPLAVFLRRRGWGRPAALRFPETASVRDVFHGGRRPGSGWRETIRLAAVGLCLIAAARPQWNQSVETISASGLDIVLALDISGSMSARDFEPQNRLQAAKAVLRDFLQRAQQDRIGLIAFAARAYSVCPLTLDYPVVQMLLEHLEIGMTTDGTALGMAITTAVNRLKRTTAKSKVIILLTDGRNNMGAIDPRTAAELAAALKVRIYTIGMGQPGGAPIMIRDAVRGERALLNQDGSVHMEDVDEEVLRHIAASTGGRYFRATDQEKLRAIYNEIRKLEQARLKSKHYAARKDVGHVVLMWVLLLLGVELVLAQSMDRRLP